MSIKRLLNGKVYVKKSKLHGYGVFADKAIRKGEKIEECYIIGLKGNDDSLEDYYFDAGRGREVIFTGYGCIYNHSDDPNADYDINMKKRIVVIKAAENIKKDEEVFISYGEEWFSSRDKKAK